MATNYLFYFDIAFCLLEGVCGYFGCEWREINVGCFKQHSFVTWRYIEIFVIYDSTYNIINFFNINLPLLLLSQWRYELGISRKSFIAQPLSQHVSSAPHCKIWGKGEGINKRDYLILGTDTRPTFDAFCRNVSSFKIIQKFQTTLSSLITAITVQNSTSSAPHSKVGGKEKDW
jgi:hypothetical protein